MKYAIIHIADIHFKKQEHEGAKYILKLLLHDLEEIIKDLTDYKIYFTITGDIVHEGTDDNAYSKFIQEFTIKLDEIGLSKSRRILVPGNHDLDRSLITENISKYSKNIRSIVLNESKFNNRLENKEYKSGLFGNYKIFESFFADYGLNFSPQGKGWELNDEIGIYCLNSAIASCGGINKIDDTGHLAVYTRDLVDWCEKRKTTTNILLMHHPLDCLVDWCKEEVKQILDKYFNICLCGHLHEQEVRYNKISHNCLICVAPQLFTHKEDKLGYGILCLDDEQDIDKIIYRQYVDGKFLNGQKFTGNNEGILTIYSKYRAYRNILKTQLDNALTFFNGQKSVFIKPKISKEREFNDDENLIDDLLISPHSCLIVAQPQFGLTSFAHYMKLEAFKNNGFWIYINSRHVKARQVAGKITEQLGQFNKQVNDISCIIIDSWSSSYIDHTNILKYLDSEYKDIPIIILSTYREMRFSTDFDFSVLNHKFETLHLQAFERNKVREFVTEYSKINTLANEDILVTNVVKELEALNIHRTPLNCLTLIKVFERDFNENIINRTRMIKALLFILFSNSESFTYSSNKPNVSECEYIIGRYCKFLIKEKTNKFKEKEFKEKLTDFIEEKLLDIDLDTIIDVLETNNIILRRDDEFEFKHSYWIYYFAATYMLHDDHFRDYVLLEKRYVDFHEIIEFYTGLDGKRNDAIETLNTDLNELITVVNEKIGINGEYNPFENVVWNPSQESIDEIRENISEKLQKSNLPNMIKDHIADKVYDSETPYDQSINRFFKDYSVVSLIEAIKAASKALRNSNFVDTGLRRKLTETIFQGWEQISKVYFLISPTLAARGWASYDGLGVTLVGPSGGSFEERLNGIVLSNPINVAKQMKEYLSSKKLGRLIYKHQNTCESVVQKHLIGLFLIYERPEGWQKQLFDFMNSLHKNSFILSDLNGRIKEEIKTGFLSDDDIQGLNSMLYIVIAKHRHLGSATKNLKQIPRNQTINVNNKLPVDKVFAEKRRPKYLN